MSITASEANAALGEIEMIRRRVRQSRIYRQASLILPVWGVTSFIGYAVTFVMPRAAIMTWTIADIAGIAGTIAICLFYTTSQAGRTFELRIFGAFAIIVAFGLLWTMAFAHFSPRALSAFWPTFFMMGYTLAGLWLGAIFFVIGLGVTLLTIAGFYWSGDWFDLWMAFVDGGGLILGGLWMRRS